MSLDEEKGRIEGTVESIIFRNDDNGYTVVRVSIDCDLEEILVGYMPNILPGENIKAIGDYVSHNTYGHQFAVKSFETTMPDKSPGILKYLSSSDFKGIGLKLAERIVKKFGADVFDIILNEPQRLSEIPSITPQKAANIRDSLIKQTEIRDIMSFLISYRLPLELTSRLYGRFKGNTIDSILQNPYILCDEGLGVDFSLVDHIFSGISVNAEDRMRAGVIYTLRFNLSSGHTFAPRDKLASATAALLDCDEADVNSCIDRLVENNVIILEDICSRQAVYLEDIHHTEVFVADYLYRLSRVKYEYEFEISSLVQSLEKESQINYAELQRKAIEDSAKYGLVVLTGGPGTGKTTTVRGMLEVFDALSLNTALAAPTGRAAKRLSELCGREAKTIHRLLEATYYSGEGRTVFKKNRLNPIDFDAVILDEVSMIDISLIKAFLEALPDGVRLILVGDADQLPPVGPGNVLRDLISSEIIATIQLKDIFRQAQESGIVVNAHAINCGEIPKSSDKNGDFFIVRKDRPQDIVQTVVELCKNRLPNYYNLRHSQIQVLSPARKGEAGTELLNQRIQAEINPNRDGTAEKKVFNNIFRVGDRVMQNKNNYDLEWHNMVTLDVGYGVFNGDIGEITLINEKLGTVEVLYDDKKVLYDDDSLVDLDLGYAMTVHKSQGSEFDAVILSIPRNINKRLLTRNILYTAITRAKSLLVIVGSNDDLETMVKTNIKGRRYSALKARLLGYKANDESL